MVNALNNEYDILFWVNILCYPRYFVYCTFSPFSSFDIRFKKIKSKFCLQGNTLDTPNKEKKSELYVTSAGINVGSSFMQGWRFEMEYSNISLDMPSRPDHTFLAVFDGHGGAGSAVYAAANMIRIIEATTYWLDYIRGGANDISLLGKSLSQAFLDIDDELRAKNKDDSGCTSVTAMITPKHIDWRFTLCDGNERFRKSYVRRS
jgi:hypothetical protein